MIYEFPPMLTGSESQQLKELRDYLIRLINQLNEESRRLKEEQSK